MSQRQRKDLYPDEWEEMRAEAIAEAGGVCQECGVAHLSIQISRRGLPYIVYLQLAHKEQYRTWDSEADTRVLCPVCHRRFDRGHIRIRKGRQKELAPIGVAQVALLLSGGRKYVVERAKTLWTLRAVLAGLPEGYIVEVSLLINAYVAGVGTYKRTPGGLEAIEETGAAIGLYRRF